MDASTLLGTLPPIASIIFAAFAFRRGQKSDDSTAAERMGALASDIGYIKSQLDTVTRKLEAGDDRHGRLVERVVAIEQSAKSAHRRLDKIEGKEE
jgi:tetrahydromethanopterin S-methyltransferase subunit G